MTSRCHRALLSCGLVMLVLMLASGARAQSAERLSQVKKVYVDSLGDSRREGEMRSQIVRRLGKSQDVRAVQNATDADAVIKGTEQIWTTGEVSLSPRSHSVNQAVYEGFLSVELVGKNHQTLWSYLVTPSRFRWGSITEDLAAQLVSRLLADAKGRSQPEESSASATPQDARAALKGAGATFPAPLYRKWFELFEERHADVHIDYDAVGSGEGIRRLIEGQIDFGASEMPLSDQAMSDAHRHFLHIPVVVGAVVPIYNVPGLRQKINFTPEILAGIYLGKIKEWDDPQIKKANPGAALPKAEIVVIHRSDGSGTSFVWSEYLSKVSPEWKASVGAGVAVRWPVGVEAEYNEGVAATVQRTPDSIGYVEFIYAIQHELSFGTVRNAAGQFIKADIASVTEAARTAGALDRDSRASITDAPGKAAYPIATYTWLLLPEKIEDKNKRAALLELIRWVLTSGQKSCSALGYAPLPPDIAKRGLDSVEHTTSIEPGKAQADLSQALGQINFHASTSAIPDIAR